MDGAFHRKIHKEKLYLGLQNLIILQGWSKTDKCLTMDGKEIIFGTGSCLQGQTEDECNLGLVKLQKDKYWHTHPVLLRKVKESGPKATPLGSKYV